MKRFYSVVIHPSNGACPLRRIDCNSCEFCDYIGTLGGEYYIDCRADEISNESED